MPSLAAVPVGGRAVTTPLRRLLVLLLLVAGATAFAHNPLRYQRHTAATVLTKRAPVHATFAVPRATGLAPLPTTAAVALPEEERGPGFLRRLLAHRRGGAAKGNADLKAPLAEAVGTGLLTLAIAMMGGAASGLSGTAQAAGAAVTLFALLNLTAKASGGHLNPIVTFAQVLLGKMSFGKGLVYVISQVVGGLAGAFLGKSLLAPGVMGDPSFTLSGGTLLTEMFFSFSLVLTVLQSAVSRTNANKNVAAPAISAIVGLGAALGASMNPAVAWGLCSASGQDKGSLALWLFPALATIPAALIYRLTDPDENDVTPPHVSYLPRLASSKTVRSLGPYLGENVGTFMLTTAVAIAAATGRLAGPLAAGLMFLVLNTAGGYVSGNHLNPAVSLGLWLRKGGDRDRAIKYSVAQVLGACAAATACHTAFGAAASTGKVLPLAAAGVSEGQAFGTEMLATGLFLQGILAFTGGQFSATTANLGVTATLTAALAAAGAVSGGGLNPAIATGLYLKNAAKDQMRLLWLYWVGPLLGAALTAIINKGAADANKDGPAAAVGAN